MLREILTDVLKDAGLWGMEQEVEFPVIIKKGTNDLGKEVVYYLNYSPEVRNVIYHGTDGEELFGKAAVADGEVLEIGAWDLKIVER